MTRKQDPIKRVELADGRIRYRFVVDLGAKPDGRRDQKTMTFDTQREARAERARIISERATGTLVRPNKKLTVEQVATEFLTAKADAGKKPSTVRSYQDALAPLVDRHGKLPIQALDIRHLEALRRDMLAGRTRRIGTGDLAPRTVNLALGVSTMLLKYAMRRRLVGHNVAELVDRVPADPDAGSDRAAWQTADAVVFLRGVRNDRLHAAWMLSLLGLRRGEVLGLRWLDADLTGERAAERGFPAGTPTLAVVNNRTCVAGKIIEGTPKGRGRRRVPHLPIPRPLVDALKALKATHAAEKLAAGEAYGSCPLCGGAHVVVDELGAPFRPARYSERFEALVKSAGLPRLVLHGSRHCAASILADLGVPDIVAAAWLGQTDVAVTKGYQHVMNDRIAEASRSLGEALTG
ncbi:site-specific integrase [Dactylosporangium sp. NPDC006015]|uniref:site-specific integrase n=1 Tax=Dactylosporangium sp. NPDC006015 TaxID=3154576 RepID=UPI0033A6F1E4